MPAHCFLNIVTNARMKPKIAPPIAIGMTAAGLPLWKKRFQVYEADKTTNASKMPVLFTVPCNVIVLDAVACIPEADDAR